MPDNIIPVVSGEMPNPVVRKSRRIVDHQAASASGIGPIENPGIPEGPVKGKRKNGNLGRDLGGDTAGFTPQRRKRGTR